MSRLAMDVVGSEKDYSQSPSFVEAKKHRVWFSPVYFRKESEPYMTVALARAGRNAGVTVAEVNLKLIWDVITGLKIGRGGYAYVVDRDGRLIAHPDISLVLRNTDLANLPQVASALAEAPFLPSSAGGGGSGWGQPIRQAVMVAKGINGNSVLTAHAAIAPLGWTVFVELPLSEALAPLYGSAFAHRGIARPRACPGDIGGAPPRPPHDRADPGVAGGRRADRRRRTRPPHRHPNRRRTRRARRRLQPHGGGPAEILRRPRKKGRGPHRRTQRGARPADRDRRGAAGHQQLTGGPRPGVPVDRGKGPHAVRRRLRQPCSSGTARSSAASRCAASRKRWWSSCASATAHPTCRASASSRESTSFTASISPRSTVQWRAKAVSNSAASARSFTWRCARMTSCSGRSSPPARKSGRFRKKRSRSLKTSPRRRSSQWRTRGC